MSGRIKLIYFIFLVLPISCKWNLDKINLSDSEPCDKPADCPCIKSNLFDERDGKVYNTIWIDEDGGNDLNKPGQCWMTDNLDVGIQVDRLDSVMDDGVIQKFCFQNQDCEKFGGYYTYNESIDYDQDISSKILEGEHVKGICPRGWHLPSEEEFNFLILASKGDINSLLRLGAHNSTGFSADLGGYMALGNPPNTLSANEIALYRSVSQGPKSRVVVFLLDDGPLGRVDLVSDEVLSYTAKNVGVCIRCVRD